MMENFFCFYKNNFDFDIGLLAIHVIPLDLNSVFCLLLILTCVLVLGLFSTIFFMDSSDVRDFAYPENTSQNKGKGKDRDDHEKLSPILRAQLDHNNLMRRLGWFRTSYNKFPPGTPGHLTEGQCIRLARILKLNPLSYTKFDYGVENVRPDLIFEKNTLIHAETTTFMISLVRFHEEMESKK